MSDNNADAVARPDQLSRARRREIALQGHISRRERYAQVQLRQQQVRHQVIEKLTDILAQTGLSWQKTSRTGQVLHTLSLGPCALGEIVHNLHTYQWQVQIGYRRPLIFDVNCKTEIEAKDYLLEQLLQLLTGKDLPVTQATNNNG